MRISVAPHVFNTVYCQSFILAILVNNFFLWLLIIWMVSFMKHLLYFYPLLKEKMGHLCVGVLYPFRI